MYAMTDLTDPKRRVAIANRILAREGVVDAYGHVSLRHPDKPGQYLLSCSRSPELVQPDDVMAFTFDGEPASAETGRPYLERHIHGGIYAARPDIQAVVHNHAAAVIPFSLAGIALRPAIHVAAVVGAEVPVWDIRDSFGDTDMLVRNVDHGRDLAAALGAHTAILMRGHGATIAGQTLEHAVTASLYLMINARIVQEAAALSVGGLDALTFLTEAEVEHSRTTQLGDVTLGRVWDYLVSRAGIDF
jgi:ribulose-5-phosphate 4-epimerase/fuculose-1-phosphate aldolase